jgi:predicted Co/Zn/Cd cation transporter (cation efflux family)
MNDKYVIEIKKRSWIEWLLWAIWLFAEVSLLQMAIASGAELEPRPAAIFWVTFFVLLVAGVIVWFMRRNK